MAARRESPALFWEETQDEELCCESYSLAHDVSEGIPAHTFLRCSGLSRPNQHCCKDGLIPPREVGRPRVSGSYRGGP